MVNSEFLTTKAIFYCRELWGVEFDLPVTISKRYYKTLGECFFGDRITISSKILDNDLFTDDILLHELCHWYLYKQGMNYSDNSTDFLKAIRMAGAHMSGVLCKVGNRYFSYREGYKPKQELVDLNKKFYEQYCGQPELPAM